MKTKHYSIIFLFLLQTSLLKAQNYFPFPTGDATWQVTRCFYFFPPGWYDDYKIHMPGEDTLINGNTFKKLYFTDHHAPGSDFDTIYPTVYLGAIREENKKVYFVSDYLCLDTLQRCVYDFNPVGIGDTIKTQFLTPGSQAIIPHIVIGIDSVLIGSQYHRDLQLTDVNYNTYEEWIEGVGSNYGLIYASFWMVTDNSYDLICFSENNINEWLNPSPSFGFCQSPLPPVECDSLATGVTLITENESLLYPNPAAGKIWIAMKDLKPVDHFELKDVTGRTAASGSIQYSRGGEIEIDLSGIRDGIYFLSISFNGQQIMMSKVLKKE